MISANEESCDRELRLLQGQRKTPMDLLRRATSNEDYVDTAVIGGIQLWEIVKGKVAEHQIPADVLKAFHQQYPHLDSFTHTVQDHAGDPQALAGIVNGVKGKLFEDQYSDWLNHGHLPDGFHAELAQSPNNPAWDILIKDSHGHAADVLQAKATASIGYVREALAAHPDIDVVTTSEVFHSLSAHGDDLSHIVDSHQDLAGITSHVEDAASHAESAGQVAFHIPWLAVGFAVVQNVARYRNGAIKFEDALKNAGRRVGLAFGAAGAGFVVADLFFPGAGFATAVGVRLFGNRLLQNLDLRDLAQRSVGKTQTTIGFLKTHILPRPLETKLLPEGSASGATAGSG